MSYYADWFGDTVYYAGWYDFPASGGGTSSGTGGKPGVSKAVPNGKKAPRPPLPMWRQITGTVGNALTDVRNFMQDIAGRDYLYGNHVTVTFTAANVATKVSTGLSTVAKGYRIEKSNANITVFDAEPSSTIDPERGVIWLQASGPGTATIYVY